MSNIAFNNKSFNARRMLRVCASPAKPKHPTYLRLFEVLSRAANSDKPAEMARWLSIQGYSVQQQHLNNWSRRGVPKEACVDLGKLLDASPLWLFFGDQRAAPYGCPDRPISAGTINQDAAHYGETSLTPAESRLLQAFRIGSEETRAVLLSIAGTILKTREDLEPRTGTH